MHAPGPCPAWREADPVAPDPAAPAPSLVGAPAPPPPLPPPPPPAPDSPIRTVKQPMAIVSGGPAQVHMSPTLAAGIPPIRTVGLPGGITGPPTCGGGGVPGLTMGQVCMSPTRAAGIPPIRTVGHPIEIVPPWLVRSPCRAAGLPMPQFPSWHPRLDARCLGQSDTMQWKMEPSRPPTTNRPPERCLTSTKSTDTNGPGLLQF